MVNGVDYTLTGDNGYSPPTVLANTSTHQ